MRIVQGVSKKSNQNKQTQSQSSFCLWLANDNYGIVCLILSYQNASQINNACSHDLFVMNGVTVVPD